mmetsp:Transcript_30692/g.64376  ORF Transcript_30692/g.64376 Transcript_30692/m.64376 type:complete len:211 (+) Transcript_30692:995-1627(+)
MSVGHRFPFLRVVLVLVLVVPRFVSFRCDRVCCPRLASGPRIGSPGWFAGSETRTNERLCRAGTKGENRTHPFFGGSVPPSRVRARSFVSPSSSTSSRANGKRESRCRPECPARACDHGSFSRCGSVRFGSLRTPHTQRWCVCVSFLCVVVVVLVLVILGSLCSREKRGRAVRSERERERERPSAPKKVGVSMLYSCKPRAKEGFLCMDV